MTPPPSEWLLLLAPLLPALFAALGLARRTRRVLPSLCIIAPLPALALALLAPDGLSLQAPWLLLGTAFGIDATGRAFLLLFSLLWMVASWHAFFYLRKDQRRGEFAIWLLLAMAGNMGTAVAQDALAFYAAFAVMSFSSYGLVIHDRQATSLRAGRVYIALVIVGELALFAGILLSVGAVGDPFARTADLPTYALLPLGVGFAIKAGLIPLHFWLPLAHPAAPVPASAVLSGAMIKVGLLGALRFVPLPYADAGDFLIGLGAVSAVFGVLIGILQTNPKALLAYSSISQMGLVAIGLGLAMTASQGSIAGIAATATILFALHHGFAKAALFLGTASTPGAFHGGPRLLRLAALLLPAAALAGAPLTSGAIAKTALKSVDAGPAWVDLFLSLSSAATSILLVRFLALMWTKDGEEKPGTLAPWLLSVMLSTLTLWLWPATAAFLGYGIALSAIASSLAPVLLGGSAGLVAAWLLRGVAKPLVAPGDFIHGLRLRKTMLAGLQFDRPRLEGHIPAASSLKTRLVDFGIAAFEARLQVWRLGAASVAILGLLLMLTLLR